MNAADVGDLDDTIPPIKVCLCGVSYSAESWATLRRVGIQDDGEGGELELRDCTCSSTIAIQLAPVAQAIFSLNQIVRVRATGQGGRIAEVRVSEPRLYAAGDGAFVFVVCSLIDGLPLRTFVGAELEAAPELVERDVDTVLAIVLAEDFLTR